MFWMLIKCPSCGRAAKPRNRRQRTAYVDDRLNWAFECDECFKETCEYWDSMWADYYDGVYGYYV